MGNYEQSYGLNPTNSSPDVFPSRREALQLQGELQAGNGGRLQDRKAKKRIQNRVAQRSYRKSRSQLIGTKLPDMMRQDNA
jgi:hypothetical protein